MSRLLWLIGEIAIGVALAGITAGILVPAVMQSGREPDARLFWAAIAATVIVSIAVGERLRTRRKRPHLS